MELVTDLPGLPPTLSPCLHTECNQILKVAKGLGMKSHTGVVLASFVPHTIVTANLKDLVCELQEVTDWFHLGICLGILLATLQSIKRNYRHIDERRREVLLAWRDNEKPTWPKLVGTLVDMKNLSLAYRIAGKYGTVFTNIQTICILLEHVP